MCNLGTFKAHAMTKHNVRKTAGYDVTCHIFTINSSDHVNAHTSSQAHAMTKYNVCANCQARRHMSHLYNQFITWSCECTYLIPSTCYDRVRKTARHDVTCHIFTINSMHIPHPMIPPMVSAWEASPSGCHGDTPMPTSHRLNRLPTSPLTDPVHSRSQLLWCTAYEDNNTILTKVLIVIRGFVWENFD